MNDLINKLKSNDLVKKLDSIITVLDKHIDKLYLITMGISLLTMLISQTLITEDSVYSFAPKVYNVLKLIRYATYLILCGIIFVYIWKDRVKRIPVILIGVVGFLTLLGSKDFQMFSYVLFVLGGIVVAHKKTLKTYVYVQGGFLLVMALLIGTGILENIVFDHGGRIRHTLGFTWVTTGPMIYLHFMMNYLYVFKEKSGIKTITVLLGLHILAFVLTDSKFIFLIGLLYIIAYVLLKYKTVLMNKLFECKAVQYMISGFPWIACLACLFAPLFYNANNPVWSALNNALSGRLLLGNNGYNNYNITLFGQKITFVGYSVGATTPGDYSYIDSSYLQIMFVYGVIILLLIVLGYFLLIRQSQKLKDYNLLIVIMCVLVLSMTEPRLVNVLYNPFIILTGYCLERKMKI